MNFSDADKLCVSKKIPLKGAFSEVQLETDCFSATEFWLSNLVKVHCSIVLLVSCERGILSRRLRSRRTPFWSNSHVLFEEFCFNKSCIEFFDDPLLSLQNRFKTAPCVLMLADFGDAILVIEAYDPAKVLIDVPATFTLVEIRVIAPRKADMINYVLHELTKLVYVAHSKTTRRTKEYEWLDSKNLIVVSFFLIFPLYHSTRSGVVVESLCASLNWTPSDAKSLKINPIGFLSIECSSRRKAVVDTIHKRNISGDQHRYKLN